MLRCGFGRTCFLTILTCSTRTLRSSGNTRSTRPSFPLSRPVMTFTVSLRRMSTRTCAVLAVLGISPIPCCPEFPIPGFKVSMFQGETLFETLKLLLQHLGCQRNNLQKFLFTQLAGDRTEHASSYRLAGFIDQYRGILVEADIGSVAPPMFFAGTHDDRFYDFALLYLAVGRRFLHTGGDHVAEPGPETGSAAERQDHLQLARAGVVGHLEHRSHHHSHKSVSLSGPDATYWASLIPATAATSGTSAVLRMISFNRQRFSFDNGRVSSSRTKSPTWASFFSSCA